MEIMDKTMNVTNDAIENNQNGEWGAVANKIADTLKDPQAKPSTKAAIVVVAGVAGMAFCAKGVIAIGKGIWKLCESYLEFSKQKE